MQYRRKDLSQSHFVRFSLKLLKFYTRLFIITVLLLPLLLLYYYYYYYYYHHHQ